MSIFPSLFSSPAPKEELAAVFHIGSSSVCGALFLMRKSGIPKIIFSVKEPISPLGELDAANLLSLSTKALDVVAGEIAASGLGAPKKIFCVLSSPWYVSENRIIRLEKNTPFVFNAKLADSLIEKEIKFFTDEHEERFAESGARVRPIELKNIQTILNGYEARDPCNQKAKELEMTLFISMGEEAVLSGIEDIAQKHFHQKEIKFSSFLMAVFTVVRDMYVHQEDFLLVDIGGEVTDISMVKRNLLRASASYPLGSNFLIRNLASSLHTDFKEAKSLFSLYKDGHAEAKAMERVEPTINKLKTEWLKKFQDSLSNLSSDISIPAAIFLTVDKDFANFFAEVIKTEQFNQYTLTESKFQVIFLNTEALHGVAAFEDEVIRDTFLIIDTLYINRFLNQ